MPRITLDLLRKRSEHNEGEIGTLEEIALHQENIERIELIDATCKQLKILLLQHNLVSKIENLSKLKRLEYLNLALNNIEIIENLEGLESLKKLDLTVNFVGDLRGIKRLRCNELLEQLFLTGNPCTDYEGYREYVVAMLPQLQELDGTPIERSERIKALQVLPSIEGEIARSCWKHEKTREAEILKRREETGSPTNSETGDGARLEPRSTDEDDEIFWKRPSRHTPEERVAIAERFLRKQELRDRARSGGDRKLCRIAYEPKLFSPDGRPYNVNQPKVPFKLNTEEYSDRIVLEVAVYRYLDTSYVDVDVQPEYVRVTIKGKVLQLTLPCEVSVNDSTACRSTTNGALVVTMPRLNPLATIVPAAKKTRDEKTNRPTTTPTTNVRAYLEIGPVSDDLDFSKIVRRPTEPGTNGSGNRGASKAKVLSPDDDSASDEVPPLE